jgi:hypothetical protein
LRNSAWHARVVRGALRTGLMLNLAGCELYEGRSLDLFRRAPDESVECTTSGDCPMDRTYCVRGACVACLVDADCPRPNPACVGNSCVECRRPSDCAMNQSCNSVLNRCALTCSEASECAGRAETVCSGDLNLCVQCLADTDCTEPKRPVCSSGGRCAECHADAQCPPDRPYCDLDGFKCVECLGATACDGRLCDGRDGRCVDCLSDADCGPAGRCDPGPRRCQEPCGNTRACSGRRPICEPRASKCIECMTAADCTEPRRPSCSASGQCVQCLSDTDCTEPNKPACITASERCGECTRDEHCPTDAHCDLAAARCVVTKPVAPPAMAPPAPGPMP